MWIITFTIVGGGLSVYKYTLYFRLSKLLFSILDNHKGFINLPFCRNCIGGRQSRTRLNSLAWYNSLPKPRTHHHHLFQKCNYKKQLHCSTANWSIGARLEQCEEKSTTMQPMVGGKLSKSEESYPNAR